MRSVYCFGVSIMSSSADSACNGNDGEQYCALRAPILSGAPRRFATEIRGIPPSRPRQCVLPPSLISTSATRLTPLHASARLPSRVTDTLRTTPPPDGIAQVWNFSVFGSNRTTVFGFTPDSLYQMTSRIEVMPYGSDCGPPG